MTKFSQITQNGSPALTDYVVGVTSTNSDDIVTMQNLLTLFFNNVPNTSIKSSNIDFTTFPNFSAYASATSSATGVNKVPNNTKEWDNYSAFDNVTNYRYTIPVTGKYNVKCQTRIGSSGISTTAYGLTYIFKNGAEFCRSNQIVGSGNTKAVLAPNITRDMSLVAGDYIEQYMNVSESRDMGGGANLSWFSASLISR